MLYVKIFQHPAATFIAAWMVAKDLQTCPMPKLLSLATTTDILYTSSAPVVVNLYPVNVPRARRWTR